MNVRKNPKSFSVKPYTTRGRIAVLSAAAAGLPLVATALPALADISITYSTVGSSQLFLPQTGQYTFDIAGAQGGSNGPILAGGGGARIQGTTANFTSRDSLTFFVGGQGSGTSDFTLGAGGGGGSFLFDNTTSSLLLAAGGGGGEGGGVNGSGGQASTTSGSAGGSGGGQSGGAGGTAGSGGQGGTPTGGAAGGAGGGGFSSAGQSTSASLSSATGGGAFSGLAGGTSTEPGLTAVTGGYGGGGATLFGGGGGGGYSGGGGGGGAQGGGGGSFVAPGITTSGLFSNLNTGNGFIIFSPTTANLTIVYGATGAIAGAISGGGAVIMSGTGNPVLTSTNNSWTGGTTISSGTFTIGDGGADGSLPGNVTNNSKLVFDSSSSLTVAGNISGTGTLTQSGSGTTILSGTNTYSGQTTISAGTLQLGNGGNPGLIQGPITDNASLVTDLAAGQTYSNVISGSGNLTTTGSGVIYFNKQQTYGGSTTIENTAIVELIANALPATTNLSLTDDFVSLGGNFNLNGIVNGAQTVASLSGDGGEVDIGSNATFTVNQSTNTVFAGQIEDATAVGNTDTGKLIKQGAGTLVLTGANIYGGGTTISGGTLQIGNGGTTGSVAGAITDNANLAFNRTDSITFSNNVSGSGSLTQAGTGTVALTGTCTFTGGTTISAGSLQIGNGGSTGSITGSITDDANLTFDTSGAVSPGKISGTGGITQDQPGQVYLNFANTYAGSTVMYNGDLNAGVTNALPVTTSLTLNGGTLVYNASNISLTIASLAGAGGNVLLSDGSNANDTLIVNQSANTNYGGLIYDYSYFSIPDDAKLIKQGSGNLTLTNNNVIGGGTTISAGTLQIGNGGSGSITGNILDNAQLTYDLNSPSTVSGTISGTGAMTQAGSSTLVLTATNSYTGGTTISTGATLQLGSGGTTGSLSGTGAILDNGNLTFDRSDSITFSNYIHGNGSVTQAGAGTVNLSTSNSYIGSTNVTSGKLVISAVNGLAESPVSITGGVLQLAQNTGEEIVTGLSISGASTLDITNNHLIIDYTPGNDPIASIAAWIADGAYGSGTTVTWTGTGITAAAANSGSYGIGYADSADPGNPAGLASGQIEIAYTLLGDANLDDKVNGTDFNLMATNFNQAVTNGWDKGDFNYDGKVNGNDFVLLAANFNQFASQSDVSSADLAALDNFAASNGISLTTIPEPASSGMLLIAGGGILHRRRRSSLNPRKLPK